MRLQARLLTRVPGLQVEPADVVIIEGILVLHEERLRDMLNMKIFVDTDDDVRLARRHGARMAPSFSQFCQDMRH